MRVVDHHPRRRTREVAQRIREKHFAVETLKRRVALEEQHPRVAKHRRGRLHLALLARQFQLVWRGVVLHLFTGLEVITAYRRRWRLPDAMPAAEGSQRLVRQRRP